MRGRRKGWEGGGGGDHWGNHLLDLIQPTALNGHKKDKHPISPDKGSGAKALELARVWEHGMDVSINTPPNGDKMHSVKLEKRQKKG